MLRTFAVAVFAGLLAISMIGCQKKEEMPKLPVLPPEFQSPKVEEGMGSGMGAGMGAPGQPAPQQPDATAPTPDAGTPPADPAATPPADPTATPPADPTATPAPDAPAGDTPSGG